MAAHARLSASAAHRWIPCPGSVQLSAGIPDTTSANAAEGTLAHDWAAHKLDPANNPAPTIAMDDSMVEYVGDYVGYCKSRSAPAGCESWVERDLTPGLRKLDQDCGGTADFMCYNPVTRDLLVADFKYGAGVFVVVEGNPQLMLYALGALQTAQRPVKTVTVAVFQPRAEDAAGNALREWTVPVDELLAFAVDVKAAAEATRDATPLLNPGEKQCQWCKAKRLCPALESQTTAIVAADFGTTAPAEPEKLRAALDMIPTVKARIKALEDFAYMELAAGRAVPGYKLVEKRATRKWVDEAAALAELLQYGPDVVEKPALKSPAQVEKALGKKTFAQHAALASAVSSGYTLVSESDSRPAVALISATDFPVLTSQE